MLRSMARMSRKPAGDEPLINNAEDLAKAGG